VNHRADLLIATYHLSSISGLQLARSLRSRQQAVPIVLLSADPIAAVALGAGADRFLQKPFALSEFERVVGELLPP
jgi:DNA-binding response OmpR family regulator